jgi:crotonobetainyl-CoA:carnitine CoA-transferase CaiB-like acyl-CoA transferase
LKFSDTPVEYKLPPPRLGEHTEDILTGLLGYSSEKIIDLKESGVI